LESTDIYNIKFPSTRFQGSKRKIIHWIYEAVKDLKFETCLDGFGGTGVVSYLFKRMGKSVTYNDILKFNYNIGLSLIENDDVNINPLDLLAISPKNILNNPRYFISDAFDDIYYLKKENKQIDLITQNILSLNSYDDKVIKYKKAIAFNALFQTCLQKRPFNLFHRKNLYLRTNKNVIRTFGNKKTWEKPLMKNYISFINEINSLIFNSGRPCFAINNSIFDISETQFDLVYFDPPYFRKDCSNETSNYLNNYHFLEGLVNYDNWIDFIDFNSVNLKFNNSYIENEFQNENIVENFEILFDKFKKSIIVVSYKKGGTPSIDTLKILLKKFKKNVHSKSIQYSYSLNHQNGNAKNNREVLIVGY